MHKFKVFWLYTGKLSDALGHDIVYASDESSAKHAFLYAHPNDYAVLNCQMIQDDQDKK